MRKLRYWLKARFSWWRVPIRSGPLRGQRIGVMCGMRFVGGRYDPSAVRALSTSLHPGMTVYDVGAHVGYLTLLAAQRVGGQGRVIAFEPLPLNLRYLRGHLRANRLEQVSLVEACVSDRAGPVHFDPGKGTGRGRLLPQLAGSFRSVGIDEEVTAGRLPPPGYIKMDVEGAELLALQGARQTLLTHRPEILLSVHGERLKQDCSRFLSALGYTVLAGEKPGEVLARWPAGAAAPTCEGHRSVIGDR